MSGNLAPWIRLQLCVAYWSADVYAEQRTSGSPERPLCRPRAGCAHSGARQPVSEAASCLADMGRGELNIAAMHCGHDKRTSTSSTTNKPLPAPARSRIVKKKKKKKSTTTSRLFRLNPHLAPPSTRPCNPPLWTSRQRFRARSRAAPIVWRGRRTLSERNGHCPREPDRLQRQEQPLGNGPVGRQSTRHLPASSASARCDHRAPGGVL